MKLFKDKSVKMSLPETKELYGVKIVKLPVARYIAALDVIENLPNVLINQVMPEVSGTKELLDKLKASDSELTEYIILKLLKTMPAELCRILSELLDIPAERLLDKNCKNPLSLNELLEIVTAFWEMNDMTDFFVSVRRLRAVLTARTQENTGSSDGSQ